MNTSTNKYLFDIHQAAQKIQKFLENQSLTEYKKNDLLKSAVERQFEIIGEAFNQMLKHNPSMKQAFPQSREIISFRNLLIHGYAKVNDELVWNIADSKLPELLKTLTEFLK